MNNIQYNEFKNILATYEIESLAISSRFKIRNTGKISAQDFLISFFCLMAGKCFSLRQWSITLSNIINQTLSFQAIAKRLNSRSLNFVKSLICLGMARSTSLRSCTNNLGGLVFFNRVLIEDSTCIKLPSALFSEFPGSRNQFDKNISVARIQLCVDIKNGDYVNYGVNSYRDNDHSYASNIITLLKPNDLVIRDLGYSSYDTFKKISEKKAYYIARLQPNSTIYSASKNDLIDLVKVLKKAETNGLRFFESIYLIGTNKLRCRVICTKLSQAQIKKRVKQRKNGKGRNTVLSKKLKYLLGWNLLITNIKEEDFAGRKIFKLYSLRWHIELIFKTWKSYFNLDLIFKSCQGPNRVKPEILLYLCLCFIVIVVNPQFKKYQNLIHSKFNKLLSPMKFIKTILNDLDYIICQTTQLKLLQLSKTCCYDIRKDRINIYERIIYT